MKKKIIIAVSVISSLFIVFIVGLNIAFYCNQRNKDSINYGCLIENVYDIAEDAFNELMVNDYIDKMYVSEENSDWLISNYNDGISINKYLGNDENVIIPEKLDGKTVLRLSYNYVEQSGDYISSEGPNSFDHYHHAFDNSNIKTLTIPSGVREIVDGTFACVSNYEPTLVKISVSKDNPVFFSNKNGEIGIKKNNEIIYSYDIEEKDYNFYRNLPSWLYYFILDF